LPLSNAAAGFYQRGHRAKGRPLHGETKTNGNAASAKAFRLVIAAGLLLSLAANLPGQMSADSVITLEEARSGVRQTWAPAVNSWLLGLFDKVLHGTGLYVTASAALLFLSLAGLPRLRGRSTWLAVVLAALVVLTPQLLIYQGIVWRDVLFANLCVAGFLFIAQTACDWGVRRRPLALAGALVCLSLAVLARQNGVVLALAAAIALGWTARGDGWRAALSWGVGGLVAVGLLALGINHLAQPGETVAKLRPNAAALILQHYDVVGAAARDRSLRLGEIRKVDPAAAAAIESRAPELYSAVRIDTLDSDPGFQHTLWHVPDAAMSAQWRQVILHDPVAYLTHRAGVFRWLLAPPKLEQCLPVQVGVVGPPAMIRDLDIQGGMEPRAKALGDYAARFYGTPVYSHAAYLLLALAVGGLLLLRRDRADWVIIALQVGAIGFVASFFLISVACDYRYLYLLDLAALTGALYVAVDPPWRGGRSPAASGVR
jgi:hypothetical protein